MWVSAFLIDGLLIDAGHHHARKDFLKKLNFDEIEKGVLSHHHEDHYGASYDLLNKYKIPLYANKETAFLIRNRIRIPPERNLVWGVPKPCKIQELSDYKEIRTSKSKFSIIPSPGHCNNLLSFYNKKKKLLFSTDAFISNQQSVVFNWENANLILKTLKLFLTLDFRYLFLEDGSLSTPNDVKELINYWKEIKKRADILYKKGYKSNQIVRDIFGKESILRRMTGGDMSRENLVRSLLNLPPINLREKRRKKY
jgi:glyoxylase-like metal-dependent hydrolase (beta-lactamase superfamily II)